MLFWLPVKYTVDVIFRNSWNKVKMGKILRKSVTKMTLLNIVICLTNSVITSVFLLLYIGISRWRIRSPARRRNRLLRRDVDLFSTSVNYKAGRLVTYKLLTYQFRFLNKWAESLWGATRVSLAKTNCFDVFGKARH